MVKHRNQNAVAIASSCSCVVQKLLAYFILLHNMSALQICFTKFQGNWKPNSTSAAVVGHGEMFSKENRQADQESEAATRRAAEQAQESR
jgi:hypothetical protein